MRSAVIHGLLLAVMLIYGYRTWTRDKSTKPDLGSVVLWDKNASEIAFLEYKSDKKDLKIERRGDGDNAFWWAVEGITEKKIKPPEEQRAHPAATAGGRRGEEDARVPTRQGRRRARRQLLRGARAARSRTGHGRDEEAVQARHVEGDDHRQLQERAAARVPDRNVAVLRLRSLRPRYERQARLHPVEEDAVGFRGRRVDHPSH